MTTLPDASTIKRKGCEEEYTRLLDLARRLEGRMSGNDAGMTAWYRESRELAESSLLESLEGELRLEELSLELRTLWLRHASRISGRYLKSPPHFQTVQLPSGNQNPFPYERWNQPVSLERRAFEYRPTPEGWVSEHLLFSSGMGAISCLLQVIRQVFEPRTGNPLLLHGIGGYFEITDLMNFIRDELFQPRIMGDQEEFTQSVADGASQLIYIEPVFTSRGRLNVFEMERFLSAWQHRPASVPTAIVFDTTFTGNRFPMAEFIKRLAPHHPRLVIQVSSTLKLDQEGLEFSNAGLMSILSTTPPIVSGITKRMRKYRAAMGFSLSLDQTAALDYPGFLDADFTEQHASAVFENNATLARNLETGADRLFVNHFHPSLAQGHKPAHWAVAPFVNLQLRDDIDPEGRELLKHVIFHEARKRKLTFTPGSSFGFRGHRVETSIQDEPDGLQVIRVAMGSRKGPSLAGTVDLLNDIGRTGSVDMLKARYPELLQTVKKFMNS
ncbi:MAG TPA: hypothetical protein ENK05_10335 [Gammaproteobacteria bacterium]|nr:hypothetical protein [Gammaproteobacteria bacterium]